MAAVELMQCNAANTGGYTPCPGPQALIPLKPRLYVFSSVVFQHKSSKSLHFASSPSCVVTTNEGLEKSKVYASPIARKQMTITEEQK